MAMGEDLVVPYDISSTTERGWHNREEKTQVSGTNAKITVCTANFKTMDGK